MTFNQSLVLLILSLFAVCQPVPERESQSKTLTEVDGPFQLTGKPLRVTFKSGDTVRAALEQSADNKIFLVVRGLHMLEAPGVSFAVYVEEPGIGTGEPRDRHRVGSLNFFGLPPASRGDDPTTWRSYDLTGAARDLLARGRLTSPLQITIEAQGIPAPRSDATIASLAIVQR
jgi:hypothetical protein